ncbi:MAG: hypothetical protein WA948_05035 [Pontixanthobacter sp.]
MSHRVHRIWRMLAAIPFVAALFVAQYGGGTDTDDDLSIGNRMAPENAGSPMAALAIPMTEIAAMPPFFAIFDDAVDPQFGGGDGSGAGMDAAGPEPRLIGIAGRLPDDAEVLLRMADGRTTSLRIGESANGWRLVSIASDRAVFSDRERRIVLTMGPMP